MPVKSIRSNPANHAAEGDERIRTAVPAPSANPVYERPAACPKPGQIEPFDAGWNAHEVGLGRETVRVLSPDPGWALLGWDSRELVVRRSGVPS